MLRSRRDPLAGRCVLLSGLSKQLRAAGEDAGAIGAEQHPTSASPAAHPSGRFVFPPTFDFIETQS